MVNIAEILRAYFKANEPIYSPVCGKVTDWYVKANGDIVMKKCDITYTFDEFGLMDGFGECLVFPSKDKRDWKDYEPKYRPFKDGDECFEEMKKHEPLGWVILEGAYRTIASIQENYLHIDTELRHFESMFAHARFADGTPFGIKEGGEK
jgi:hypothetical protein